MKLKLRSDIKDLSSLILNDPNLAIKLSFNDPKIDSYCRKPEFSDHWKNILKKYDQQLAKELLNITLPDYKIRPIHTIHIFDQLKGIYMYMQYLIAKNNPKKYSSDQMNKFLDKSSQLGCYQSLLANNIKFLSLYKSNKNYSYAQLAISYAEQVAEKYWTPGYLLLASTYHELTYDDRYTFMQGFKYLLIAEKLEKYSRDMINNAFRGTSLNTKFKFKTWMDAKKYMTSYLTPSMNIIEIQQSYQLANETVNSIVRRYELEQENTIEETRQLRM